MTDKTTLSIATDLSIPLEAMTQTFAILAKRGAGKTFTALVMMEEMLKAGLHVVIVDPVGVCWGLRASADGKQPGLPIIVLGGDHGDVPLEASAGEIIADFVITERQSVVLDLSLFRKGEQARFVTDFAERLYQRNRDPLHVLLDEADAFAPQRPVKGQERMLGAIEDIVRRGRARGLGVSLVTQRAAVLNKDVLTQVEVLVALRTIAPQDRDAIDAWIRVHGTPEQRSVLMASLPSLPIGTAWFWSPGWLNLFQQVHVRGRETFDSSATPKVGERRITPKQLAPVDLTQLRERIAATLEQAKASDPKFLRARIIELERQLKSRDPGQVREVVKEVEKRVEVPIFRAGEVERLEQALATLRDASADVGRIAQEIQAALSAHQKKGRSRSDAAPLPASSSPAAALQEPDTRKSSLSPEAATNGETRSLRAGERKILAVLARHYPMKVTRAQLGALSGYAASGGTFGNYLSTLKRHGYVTEPSPGEITIAPAGLTYLNIEKPEPQTRAAFLDMWQEALRLGERKMLDALLAAYPDALSREELSVQADMAVTSGTFGNYLSTLKRNGLIEEDSGMVRASTLFFA